MPDSLDKDQLLKDFQKEVIHLKKKVSDFESREAYSSSSSIEGLNTLLLRLGSDGKIQYANSLFLKRFSVDKETVLGQESSLLKKILFEELYAAIKRPEQTGSLTRHVKDASGHVYEVKNTLKNDVQDIVIQDVTNEHLLKSYVSKYVSSDLTDLSEDDLRTFKYPERRFMTVSFTDLRGFTAMSEAMAPEEVRTTMNAYLEEIIHAVDENGATVDKIVGDEVMALYGAPRHYKDHALRAIKTACDQQFNLHALQRMYRKLGREMPDCGIGVNSGEMVIGNMGSSTRQDYTVLGSSVNLAARLCGAAKGAQVIITEATLNAALENLPENWKVSIEKNKTEPGLSDSEDLGGKTQGLYPLSGDHQGKVISIGPEGKPEYQFDYLYRIKVKGVEDPLPVVSVMALNSRSSLALSDESTQKESNERIFGKYRLIELIGKGGMGEVWKARDSFGNLVAIKMLLAGEGASEHQIQRFKREAQIMSKLKHPGICRIHKIGEVDKVSYITMDYIEGVDLSRLLHSASDSNSSSFGDQSLNLSEIISEMHSSEATVDHAESYGERSYRILPLIQSLTMIKKICDAVQFAHENGILHRDLKPANIMIDLKGEPIVMDFGLAKMETDTSEGMSLSISGQMVGTIDYMAPEQAKSSKHVNEQADVYSLGAIFYQMLTGKKHFVSSGNILNDAYQLEYHEPPSLTQHNSSIDFDLEVVSQKSLRPDTQDRYKSVRVFKEDLEHYERGEAVSARSVGNAELFWKWVKRNRVLSMVVSTALVTMTLGTIWFVLSLNSEKKIAKDNEIKAKEALAQFKAELSARKLAEEQQQKLEAKIEAESKREWKLVFEDDFSDPDFEDRWEIRGRGEITSEVQNGQLRITGGEPQILLLKQAVAGDIKIEFDCHQESQFLGDMSCFFNSKEDSNLDTLATGGYMFQFGGGGNKKNSIKKQKRDLWSEGASSLSRGKVFHVVAIKNDQQLSLWVNGIMVGEAEDFGPLSGGERTCVGLYGWSAEAWYDNVKVYQLGSALKVDLLDMAEHYTRIGKFETAETLFENVYQSTLDKERSQRAKIGLERIKFINKDQKEMLEKLKVSYPKGSFEITFDEKEVLLKLKGKVITDISALKGMPLTSLTLFKTKVSDVSALKGMPLKVLDLMGSPVSDLSALHDMPLVKLALQNTLVHDLSPLKDMSLAYLNISYTKVEDLSALEGMPLMELMMRSTQVSDLSPIRGMPLESLHLWNSKKIKSISVIKGMSLRSLLLSGLKNIRDLSPLKDMPLTHLRINHTPVSDLSVLKGMPIRRLAINNTRISDISVLKGMALEELDLHDTLVKDISALEGMAFSGLNLRNTPIADIKALKGMPLFSLYLDRTQVLDLSALEGMPLHHFGIDDTQVSDISALKGMPLERLFLSNTLVGDIEPLRGMSLWSLSLFNSKVSDISALKGMPLNRLGLHGTQVSDISALKGMPLLSLDLRNTPVADIKALEGMPLLSLFIGRTQVSDISVLKGMPLNHLGLNETQVSDISSLKGMPLQKLYMDYTLIEHLEPLKGISLDRLYLQHSKVNDISVLKGMPLHALGISHTHVTDIRVLKEIPLLTLEMHGLDLRKLDPTDINGSKLTGLSVDRKTLTKEWSDKIRELKKLKILAGTHEEWKSSQTPAQFWKNYDLEKEESE